MPFHAVLCCGNLASDVQVFPRPEPVLLDEELDPVSKTVNTGTVCCLLILYMMYTTLDWWPSEWVFERLSSFLLQCNHAHIQLTIKWIKIRCNIIPFLPELEIVGFIEIGDIASPPVVSRHLVLPIAVNKGSHFTSDSLLFTSFVFYDKMLISAFVFAFRGGWSGSRGCWWNGGGDVDQSDGRKESEFLCPSAWQSESGGHGGPRTARVGKIVLNIR